MNSKNTDKMKHLSRLYERADRIRKDESPRDKWFQRYYDIRYLTPEQFRIFQRNEIFFDSIHTILRAEDMDDMDLDTGKWSLCLEEEDMTFEIEYYEGEVTENISLVNGLGELVEEKLTDDQRSIITDYLDGYLQELREEASCHTGDPYRDNGVSRRDFI